MLAFCSERRVAAEVETIRVQQINEAYDRVQKRGVTYRFVIDMASLSDVRTP